MNIVTQKYHGPPGFPVASPSVPVTLDDTPGGGQQQRESEIGGGLCQHSRGVSDQDTAAGSGRNVNIIKADCHVTDYL